MGEWGRIRSWHAVRTFTRMPGHAKALCGKQITSGPYLADPPWDQKTCESCFRIKERQPAE